MSYGLQHGDCDADSGAIHVTHDSRLAPVPVCFSGEALSHVAYMIHAHV